MTVIPPEAVARRLGLSLPLTPDQTTTINDAIEDGEGEAMGYLERLLESHEETLEQLMPVVGGDLDDWRTWPQAMDRLDDRIVVLNHEANGDGFYTVTFKVGLDVANEPELAPIRRWVRAYAVESLRNNPDLAVGTRRVSSVSADGQSVSYEKSGTGSRLPPLTTLSKWKRRSAYTRPRPPTLPWPYTFTFP